MSRLIHPARPTIATLLVLLLAGVVSADEPLYQQQVKPVLRERCFACHGALKQEAGLRVDTVAAMLEGGDSGAIVEPGDPDASYVLERVTAEDEHERMPPEGKPLTAAQIEALRSWIREGAAAPAEETPERDPNEHWAFQPPVKADLPTPRDAKANPIDLLISAARRQRGLKPVASVDRSLLLRRLHLDLVGLPPTSKQLREFLADPRPDAYERAVDRLLASPQYGERWGRHWMDVWRYSDWYGLGQQLRYSQKHIWRWRDWIIESLNKDVGYDRMVRLMLAADELEPENTDDLRATGFLARNYYLFNRTTWLDSTIEHTSKALLGLTVNCAKCHDHKYDAISQDEYYAMRAIFEPHQVRLDPTPGETDLEKDGLPRVFDAHPDAKTFVHIRGDEKNPDLSRPIAPGIVRVVLPKAFKPQPVSLPATAVRPALRPHVRQDLLSAANAELAAAETELKNAQQALAKQEAEAAKAKQLAASRTQGAVDEQAEKQAANRVFADESFEQPLDDELWEYGPGDWKLHEGDLVQSRDGASRATIRSKRPHPRDFHASLEFTTTGGSMWRSVGLVFDGHDQDESMVYLSAVQPGSKLQVHHKVNGADQYPAEGRVSRPVKLNQRYRLDIRIRDRVLNVSIDGEHALAYAMPRARRPGRIQLVAFDAKVRFHALRIETLSADLDLKAPSQPVASASTLAQAKARVAAAKARLAAAKLHPAAITTALTAKRLKLKGPADQFAQAKRAAATAHRNWKLADTQRRLAAAELEADAKKRKQAIDKETKQLEQLQKLKPGDGDYLQIQVSLKALEGPDETDASRRQPYPEVSTGRRSALAQWITDGDNPLTARVAVNHIWLRHFGQPLVDPVDDFGRRTAAPPLQDVLDYLAVELMENDWRMKHLHRLIVTSHTYRLATSTRDADPETMNRDPENHYYWRRAPQRMESELIRDSLIHLGGALDDRIGGPSVKPKGQDAASGRRSLYFTHSRDDQHAFLTMFDHADILRCYRRSESIVPQQALTLANSRLSLEAARKIAERLAQSPEPPESDADFVVAAFETILARQPSSEERQACLETLRLLQEAAPSKDPQAGQQRARANLLHALINHNDFITIR